MARQLIKAAKAKGDTSVPSADNISHNIYRWERGAVAPAERYKLYYCGCFRHLVRPIRELATAGPAGSR